MSDRKVIDLNKIRKLKLSEKNIEIDYFSLKVSEINRLIDLARSIYCKGYELFDKNNYKPKDIFFDKNKPEMSFYQMILIKEIMNYIAFKYITLEESEKDEIESDIFLEYREERIENWEEIAKDVIKNGLNLVELEEGE